MRTVSEQAMVDVAEGIESLIPTLFLISDDERRFRDEIRSRLEDIAADLYSASKEN